MEKTVLWELEGQIALITLNRPEANHAIDLQMAKDLCYAAMHCSENSAVRAILITATGPVFCAGGDLKAMAGEVEKTPGLLKEMSSYLHLAISRLTRGAPPVVINAIIDALGPLGIDRIDMPARLGYNEVDLTSRLIAPEINLLNGCRQ